MYHSDSHGVVDPSSFYKQCVSDLCVHDGLQAAWCCSLAEYTTVCLSHKATVPAWRSSLVSVDVLAAVLRSINSLDHRYAV